MRVAISTTKTAQYPQGGFLWIFLNWAYGFAACGCDVTWLDTDRYLRDPSGSQRDLQALIPFPVVIERYSEEPVDTRYEWDLLIDFSYQLPRRVLRSARKTVLFDIDPGIVQQGILDGKFEPDNYDYLVSIGHIDGWHHSPPCVSLDQWPVVPATPHAPWTTVAHWWSDLWDDSKCVAFEPYMGIPKLSGQPFRLGLNVEVEDEQRRIESYGFEVVDPHVVLRTIDGYRNFIQQSCGEFSPAKRSFVRRNTGWISDRTICYLASGKPCVVEHTGGRWPLLGGMHRFRNLDDALRGLDSVRNNYAEESAAARKTAEEYFDARRVCARLLEIVS